MIEGPVTGGCQCGAVRYAIAGPLSGSHFCHCRMCQRATGGVFAALTTAPKTALRWTKGEPALFASSSVAKRGFCPACGTPLSFAYDEGPYINVTVGSLDDPGQAPLTDHCGIEGKVSWLKLCDGLPEETTWQGVEDSPVKGMTVNQSADKA